MSESTAASRTTHGLVAASAARAADRDAIGAPDRPFLTHGGLHDLVLATVVRLNELGIGRGDRVAVVLPNGPEMATAFLAISAGATIAPLNPAYRDAEFEFFLGDLSPAALVVRRGVDSASRAVADRLGVRILELDVPNGAPAGVFTLHDADGATMQSAAAPERAGLAEAGDVAMVLHTSGTTSRPKIVPLKHENLAASAGNIVATLRLTATDRCLNVMPLYHIHGLMAATLASMTAGASTMCSPGFDVQRFFAWFEACRPTWYTAVPTIHQAVLSVAPKHAALIAATRLRFVRSSSAALPPPVMAELEAVLGAPVIEGYGMTEAAHQMASNPLPPGARKPGSVGLPTGIDIAIMDDAGNLLGPNARAEIVIRGPSIIKGYESNPTANATSFTDGWFRTGDQGYKDDDGYLYISGRLKEIINKAGEKISPREIDELLMKHPAVLQAVTFAIPHPTLGEDVGAAVVLKPSASADEGALRVYAAEQLAEFKVPQRILVVAELPKGPTGKLKRIGLADHFATELATAAFVAPVSATEIALARVWEAELKQERVGVHDNYFMLGGDSLQAVMVVARARREGVVFTPNQLFTHPTIAELARAVDAEREASRLAPAPDAATPPSSLERQLDLGRSNASVHEALLREVAERVGLAPDRTADVHELTAFQRTVVATYEPRLSPSALRTSWVIRGADVATLRAAFGRVVARHGVLRSGFVRLGDGAWVQFTDSGAEPSWTEHDLSGLDPTARGVELGALLRAQHLAPFELAKPPLVRAMAVRLSSDEVSWSCAWHHAIVDLWSIGLIERELSAEYDAAVLGNTDEAQERPRFGAFVEWLGAQTTADETRAFWARELAGLDHAALMRPLRSAAGRITLPSADREVAYADLGAELVVAVQAFCRANAVTPSTLYHGAWALAQSHYTGMSDVVFGAVVSGRWGELAGLHDVVGPTMGVAPLRVRVDEGDRASTWLQALQTRIANLQGHANVPWDELARTLEPPRRTLPLWNTLVVENLPSELWERPSTRVAFREFHHATHMRTPLMLSVFPVPHPHLKITYDPAYFSSADAEGLLGAVLAVLEAAVASEGASVGFLKQAAARTIDHPAAASGVDPRSALRAAPPSQHPTQGAPPRERSGSS